MIAPKRLTEEEARNEQAAADAMFGMLADAVEQQNLVKAAAAAAAGEPAVPLVGQTVSLGTKTVVMPKSVEEHIAARQKSRKITREEHVKAQGENKFAGPEGFNVFESEEFFVHYGAPNEYYLTFDWFAVLEHLGEQKEAWRFLPYNLATVFNALRLTSEDEFTIFSSAMIPHMLLYTSGLWLMIDGGDDVTRAKQMGSTDHTRYRHVTIGSFNYVIYLTMLWQQISAPGNPLLDAKGHVQEAKTREEAVSILLAYKEYRALVETVTARMNEDQTRTWLAHCDAYAANRDIKWLYAWGIEYIRCKERAILALCNIKPELWERFLTPKCRPAPEHCHPVTVASCNNNIIAMCQAGKTTCMKRADGEQYWFISEHHTQDVLEEIKTPDQYAEIIIGDIFGIPKETYLNAVQLAEARDAIALKAAAAKAAQPPAPTAGPNKQKKLTASQKREAGRQELANRVAEDQLGAPEDETPTAEPSLSDEEKAALLLESKRRASATIAAMQAGSK